MAAESNRVQIVAIVSSLLILSLINTSSVFLSSLAQTSVTPKATPKSKSTGSFSSSPKTGVGNKSVTQHRNRKTKKGGPKMAFRGRKRAPRGQREIEPSRVMEIQNALAAAGYFKDQPSGKWDESTSQAMSAYQGANGFKVTGKPDALSLKKLGL